MHGEGPTPKVRSGLDRRAGSRKAIQANDPGNAGFDAESTGERTGIKPQITDRAPDFAEAAALLGDELSRTDVTSTLVTRGATSS